MGIAPYDVPQAIETIGKLGTKVGEIIDTVLRRVLPAEKMTEIDRAKLEQEVKMEVLRQNWSDVSLEYQDRASARTLAAADVGRGNALSNFLAATVRPVWGYASLIVVAYPYLAGAMNLPAVKLDAETVEIIKLVIMFFFGGRTIEKVLPLVMGNKEKK